MLKVIFYTAICSFLFLMVIFYFKPVTAAAFPCGKYCTGAGSCSGMQWRETIEICEDWMSGKTECWQNSDCPF